MPSVDIDPAEFFHGLLRAKQSAFDDVVKGAACEWFRLWLTCDTPWGCSVHDHSFDEDAGRSELETALENDAGALEVLQEAVARLFIHRQPEDEEVLPLATTLSDSLLFTSPENEGQVWTPDRYTRIIMALARGELSYIVYLPEPWGGSNFGGVPQKSSYGFGHGDRPSWIPNTARMTRVARVDPVLMVADKELMESGLI